MVNKEDIMDTAKSRKQIGILGGTFDPVHCGHLMIAEQVKDFFNLDEVLFIASGAPPHKKRIKLTSGQKRVDMLRLAIECNPFFDVLSLEVEREGTTYTVDTLHTLNQMYSDERKIYFIIGADVLFDLLTWKKYEDVFEMCEFIAVGRIGFPDENVIEKIEFLKEQYGAKIHLVKCPTFEVSSSFIRDSVSNGKSIKYLVPQKVEEYIKKNKLYKYDTNCK